MVVHLRPRAPEAEDDAEVVFEKLRSRHVRAALAEMHLGPVLKPWGLDRRAVPRGRPPAGGARRLTSCSQTVGVAPQGLTRRSDVATALEPEVVMEDVAPFPEAHLAISTKSGADEGRTAIVDHADRLQTRPAARIRRPRRPQRPQCTKGTRFTPSPERLRSDGASPDKVTITRRKGRARIVCVPQTLNFAPHPIFDKARQGE